MVVFHSYVSLPEGTFIQLPILEHHFGTSCQIVATANHVRTRVVLLEFLPRKPAGLYERQSAPLAFRAARHGHRRVVVKFSGPAGPQ